MNLAVVMLGIALVSYLSDWELWSSSSSISLWSYRLPILSNYWEYKIHSLNLLPYSNSWLFTSVVSARLSHKATHHA